MAWTQNSYYTLSEVALNDQDKSLLVTSGTVRNGDWKHGGIIKRVRVELTVGLGDDRKVTLSLADATGDIIYLMHYNATADVSASTTGILEFDSTAKSFTAAVAGGPHVIPLPYLRFEPGHTLRIFERDTVLATDDMIVHVEMEAF